ncbi:rhodanese-like domain-containing protein [Caldimonas brevitalea]|uniref:Sulfurtransferase n=1 Tax=Caldimonas brevitalea TaxID=413882 RepID=A0A0G3BQ48_9BURK|nr:rhodanese-like domain-containing protein [Caldimonas brevitalea]AKJ31549.1 sulfurtransferase [Caldimonas brevitalea]
MNKIRHAFYAGLGAGLFAVSSTAQAELSAMVAVEPTSRQDAFMLSRATMESGLGKALGQQITVSKSEELADVMRATRSAEYDVFIAPAQVAASALMRGYELIGSTDPAEQYVLVGRQQVPTTRDMKGGRLYLPQQDSIYTYMARGMLNASGLSFKDLRAVQHERYPQAGLTALMLGATDATVVRRSDWEAWDKAYPGVGKVLATSGQVPGGFSVVMKKDLAADLRAKVANWFANSAITCGLKPIAARAEVAEYKAVAELGLFTPTHLPGAKVVKAADVQQLIANGTVFVDTRSEKEYKAKRVPQAIFIPYHEKSLKDVAFDSTQDDFKGLAQLDKNKPVIFSCNGAECWKSYKASRTALGQGFKQVYWFRGGLPEWEAAGLSLAKN